MATAKFNPDNIRKNILESTSFIMTKEEHEQFKSRINNASDYEIMQVAAEIMAMNGVGIDEVMSADPDDGKWLKTVSEIQKKRKLTVDKLPINDKPVAKTPTELEVTIDKYLANHGYSDIVCLSAKDDVTISKFWKDDTINYLPTDIFFAGTIPLLDVLIRVDETSIPGGFNVEYRVIIQPDYRESIEMANGRPVCVGAIVMTSGHLIKNYPIMAAEGIDGLIGGFVTFGLEAKHPEAMTMGMVQNQMAEFYCTWYGIQIVLLHPDIEESVLKSTRERVYDKSLDKRTNGKRKTRYVRKIHINGEKIMQSLNHREFNRKTMTRYVIGHWRHYKGGKTVFVKPYWKGPLRNVKRNMDEGRERVIAV